MTDDFEKDLGSLFENEFKKSENSPDWTGFIEFNDRDRIQIVGWSKLSNGKKKITFARKKDKPTER